MKLSLQVPYVKLPEDLKSPPALTQYIIAEAVGKRYPQGMPRIDSRIYAKLLDQLYMGSNEIDIDEPTFNLVREALDSANLLPHMSSWKWTLLEHLDNAKKENS